MLYTKIASNRKKLTRPVTIQSTYNASDPIAWRQMHHWGLMKGLTEVKLRKGVQVLTLYLLTKGTWISPTLEFKPKSG